MLDGRNSHNLTLLLLGVKIRLEQHNHPISFCLVMFKAKLRKYWAQFTAMIKKAYF